MVAASLLPFAENSHRGCWVTLGFSEVPAQFFADLQYSLSIFRSRGFKVVWLKLPEHCSQLIDVAIRCNFHFHHVTPETEKHLVLTQRLVDGATIPDFAHHTIGVGGIVLNDNNEVLTVVEKHDSQQRPGHFKFPGGAVDKRELLAEAVVREVYEETGIKAQFNGVVGFRHYHKGQFGTSNLYFLCHLSAKTQKITPCPEEIAEAKWMKTSDYLACESIMTFNKVMLEKALTSSYLKRTDLGTIIGVLPRDYEILLPQDNLGQ